MQGKLLISATGTVSLFALSIVAFAQSLSSVSSRMEIMQPETVSVSPGAVEILDTSEPEAPYVENIGSMDLDTEESYLLAKIAMAEAEDQDTEGKALVILVVLNRVRAKGFPDTVKEVLYEEKQFSPMANGRFDQVEPDEDCWRALEMVQTGNWDESKGALYFESRSESTWHEYNLQFLFQHGKHLFYTEKEMAE